MNKTKYYITGVVFLAIAAASLGVMLFWPHPTQSKNEGISMEAFKITRTSSYGIPFAWTEEISVDKYSMTGPGKSEVRRQSDTPKLLANIIIWGIGLGLLALVMRSAEKRFIK